MPRDDVPGEVSTQQGDLGKPGKKGGADIAPVKKTVAGGGTKKRPNTPVERAGQRNPPPSFKQANASDDPSQLTRRPKPRRRWLYWTAMFILIAALIAFVVYGLNIYYGLNIDPFASIRANLEAGFTQDAENHDASPSFTENQVNPPADADNGNEVIPPQENPRKDEQTEVQRIEGAKNLPASQPRTENPDRSRDTDGAIIFDAAPPTVAEFKSRRQSYDERDQTEIVAQAQPQRLEAVDSNPSDPVQIEPDIAAEIGAVDPGSDPAVKLPSPAAIIDTVEQMTSQGSPERTVVPEETSDHGALVAADSNPPYQNSGFVAGNMRSDEIRPSGVVAPAQVASTPTAGADPVWDPIGSLEQALRQLPFHIKRLDDGTLEVDMGDTVSFDFGSAELDPSSVGTLVKLAAALKPHTDISLRVVGHTDSTGPESFNLVLSKRRAVAVGNYLIIKRGGTDDWVQAEGRGESEPVAPGNRARNRRIVLYISPVHQG
jgi:outer membrane protein OmpA-like peptidoglycan-associated protein